MTVAVKVNCYAEGGLTILVILNIKLTPDGTWLFIDILLALLSMLYDVLAKATALLLT